MSKKKKIVNKEKIHSHTINTLFSIILNNIFQLPWKLTKQTVWIRRRNLPITESIFSIFRKDKTFPVFAGNSNKTFNSCGCIKEIVSFQPYRYAMLGMFAMLILLLGRGDNNPVGIYMFKVNNKDTRTMPGVVLVSLMLTLNIFHTMF